MQSLAILGLLDGDVSGHGILSWVPETTLPLRNQVTPHFIYGRTKRELAPGTFSSKPVGRFVLAVSRDPSTAHTRSPRGSQ